MGGPRTAVLRDVAQLRPEHDLLDRGAQHFREIGDPDRRACVTVNQLYLPQHYHNGGM